METHQAVFTWVLQRLADAQLVKGRTLGIDATTLEANAALRSIVRRDTGEAYEAWLTRLAEVSGIATPTRAELARFDRKRKKKGSNDDWTHPQDPDAKITKLKDGRTHLAHTAEHAVDLETGAVVSVTVQDIDATTLEANAALRSIVRRDTGEAYEAWLTRLAEVSGIATPTRAELARFDRKRKKKGSNDDWTHPQDPDAKITKLKDGRTHLAHTAEHAVDLETGAVVSVTVQDADDDDGRDAHHRRRPG